MFIDSENKNAIYEQIVFNIKKDIINGVLKPEDKILSVRDMSKKIGVNPNTVAKAYKEMEYQGIIKTVKGKGSYIKSDNTLSTNSIVQEKLKKEFKSWIVEAKYAQIPSHLIREWLEEEGY